MKDNYKFLILQKYFTFYLLYIFTNKKYNINTIIYTLNYFLY